MTNAKADQLMLTGEELLTTSWLAFRFSPDFDGAATNFEQAGGIYKHLKQYGKAKNAFSKAASCFLHLQLPNAGARMYEQASMMARDDKCVSEAGDLLQKASLCYRENGNSEKAAEALSRAAKLLEADNLSKSIECWMEACDIYEAEEKEHFSLEAFKGALGLLVRAERWDEAVKILERQCLVFEKIKQGHNVCKACLSIIVIHLHRDDYVAADRAYNELLSTRQAFNGTSEAKLAAELLDAYEQSNPDALAACLKKQTFNYLDNNIVRLARGLTVHGGTTKPLEAPKQLTTPVMTLTSGAPQPAKGALVSGTAQELFGGKPARNSSSTSRWGDGGESSKPTTTTSTPKSFAATSTAPPPEPKFLSIELPPPGVVPETIPVPAPSLAPVPTPAPAPAPATVTSNDDWKAEPVVPTQIIVPSSLTEASQRQLANLESNLSSMTNNFSDIVLDELPSEPPKPLEPLLDTDDSEGLC